MPQRLPQMLGNLLFAAVPSEEARAVMQHFAAFCLGGSKCSSYRVVHPFVGRRSGSEVESFHPRAQASFWRSLVRLWVNAASPAWRSKSRCGFSGLTAAGK